MIRHQYHHGLYGCNMAPQLVHLHRPLAWLPSGCCTRMTCNTLGQCWLLLQWLRCHDSMLCCCCCCCRACCYSSHCPPAQLPSVLLTQEMSCSQSDSWHLRS